MFSFMFFFSSQDIHHFVFPPHLLHSTLGLLGPLLQALDGPLSFRFLFFFLLLVLGMVLVQVCQDVVEVVLVGDPVVVVAGRATNA